MFFIYFYLHFQALTRAIIYLKNNYAPTEEGQLIIWVLSTDIASEIGLMRVIKGVIVKLSIWLLLPIVLLIHTIQTIRMHIDALSYFVCIMSLLGTCLVIWLWYLLDSLKRQVPTQFQEQSNANWWRIRAYRNKVIIAIIVSVLYGFLLYELPYSGYTGRSLFRTSLIWPVDLSNEVLVSERKEEYGKYWLFLSEIHLEDARLSGTILKRAFLTGPYFQGAWLSVTNLEDSYLSHPDFQNASLDRTRLKGAALLDPNFQGAFIYKSDLTGVEMISPNFKDSRLRYVNLQDADLEFPNFDNTVLSWVDLRGVKRVSTDRLSKAFSIYKCKMDESLFSTIENSYPYLLLVEPLSNTYLDIHHNNENAQGNLLFRQGKWGDAEIKYRNAVQLFPRGATYHFNLGNSLKYQGKISEAEVEYRKALQLATDEPMFHNFIGTLLVNQKRMAEAEVEFREATRLEPENGHYHFKLAMLLQDEKKTEEAEIEYKEAIRLNPKDAIYHYFFSLLLAETKRFEEAETMRKKAVELQPKQETNWPSFEADPNLSIFFRPVNTEPFYALASMLQSRQRYPEAELQYKNALQFEPEYKDAHLHYGLATVLRDQKKLIEAKEEYEKAAQLAPENVAYQKALKDITEELNKK